MTLLRYQPWGLQQHLWNEVNKLFDDQILPIYNRLPASFANDRYVLTNSPAERATFGGMNLSVQFDNGTTSIADSPTRLARHTQYSPLQRWC